MWLEEFTLINVENGIRTVRASIYADNKPTPMPTDGSEVEGLSDTDILAPGSTIYIVGNATFWMMNSQGEWKQQ